MSSDENRVRIRFVDDQGRVENLAAEPLGENRYRLREIPSLAYGISHMDSFSANSGDEGTLVFDQVLEKSGNRTIRAILTRGDMESEEAQALLRAIRDHGCTWENAIELIIAINLPPGVKMDPLTGYLMGNRLWWEHADPQSSSRLLDDGDDSQLQAMAAAMEAMLAALRE